MDHGQNSSGALLSPYPQQGRRSPYRLPSSYSSPRPSMTSTLQSASDQGLGLYECQLLNASRSEVNVLPPSPQSPGPWMRPKVSKAQKAQYSQAAAPDIFSAAYDPFASIHSHGQLPFVATALSSTPSNVPDLSSSPTSSCNMSTRSSFSFAPVDGGPRNEAVRNHGHRAKDEGATEWMVGQGSDAQAQPRLTSHDYVSGQNTAYGAPLAEQAFEGTPHWSDAPSRSGSGRPMEDGSYTTSSSYDDQQRKYGEDGTVITNVARTRKRRQLTTAAEANHTCRVCGKLFGRSYNFKAHMETHDSGRVYAHPCLVKTCGKKFVRKTDLTRHHQSVHMKQRNYQCELCGNLFARKDTLRRHAEDGCAKRFEINSKGARGGGGDGEERNSEEQGAQSAKTTAGGNAVRPRHMSTDMTFSAAASASASASASTPASASQQSASECAPAAMPPNGTMYGKAEYAGAGSGYYW